LAADPPDRGREPMPTQCPSGVVQPTHHDRRGSQRFSGRWFALIRPEGVPQPVAHLAAIQDVSASGLCLRIGGDGYVPGLTLSVAPLGWAAPAVCSVRVTRVVAEAGDWELGCEFTRRIPPSDLESWLP